MIDARQHVTLPEGRFRLDRAKVLGIAIHHSVTAEPAPSSVERELAHIRAIDRFHVEKNYGGHGYHIDCFPSGRWYLCGELDGARAHVASRNHELIGICAIGTFTEGFPGAEQMAASAEAIRYVRGFYGRPLPVAGHNDWALPGQGTVCAGRLNGFDWSPWLLPPPPPPVEKPAEDELRLRVIETIVMGKYKPEYIGPNALGERVVELRNSDGSPAQPPIIMAVPRR